MHTSLLVLHVRSNRDVLLARGWARQVARLLGYDVLGQACIAAAVFEIACRARAHSRRTALHFRVQEASLHVFARSVGLSRRAGNGSALHLKKRLPEKPPAINVEDIGLVIRLLAQQHRPGVFAEIRRQNQELLHTVEELQNAQPAPACEATRPAA